MRLEINNLSGTYLRVAFIKNLTKKWERVLLRLRGKKVSLAFVTPKLMRKLNRRYRGIDKSTTVLSFGTVHKKFVLPKKEKQYLGEIVLCPPDIKRSASKQEKTFQNTLNSLIVHGLLHLLGYEHKTKNEAYKMEAMAKRLIQEK